MSFLELFLIAVGLSMDAFAISICKGLSLGNIKWRHMMIPGLWFGGFQALMPITGYVLGTFAADLVSRFSHWIAFAILCAVGSNMIREAHGSEEDVDGALDWKTMLLLSIATSIDALAVGASFALLQVSIIPAAVFIGCTTFVISAAGMKIGSVFGLRYRKKAAILGGVILIVMGLKILLSGMGILPF